MVTRPHSATAMRQSPGQKRQVASPAAGVAAGGAREAALSLKRPQSQGGRRIEEFAGDVKHRGQIDSNASLMPLGKNGEELIAKSASTPLLRRGIAKDVKLSPAGGMAVEGKSLPSSHYGFFASSVPAVSTGSASDRRYQSILAMKERKDLGLKAMLPLGRDKPGPANTNAWQDDLASSPQSPQLQQMPTPLRRSCSGPELFDSASPASRGSFASPVSRTGSKNRLSMELPPNDLVALHISIARAKKLESLHHHICEGMRVLFLHKAAPPLVGQRKSKGMKMSSPAHHHYQATCEEVLQVYALYRRLITTVSSNDEVSSDDDQLPPRKPHQDTVGTPTLSREASKSTTSRMSIQDTTANQALPLLAWPVFLSWLEDEVDLAGNAKNKSVVAGLLRALKTLRQSFMPLEQKTAGVSLILLLQWTWPFAGCAQIAEMLKWICLHELKQVSFQTPEVITARERRCLIGIFNNLDSEGRGFCYAEDIAGGPNPDKLRNIVDVDTVKAVIGEGEIYLDRFLELMCEDNFRGHDAAERVVLEDGQTLMHHVCDVVGFRGWILEDTPVLEESRWKTICALQAEVLHWRSAAKQDDQRGSAVRMINVLEG